MAKIITLTRGCEATIDDADFDRVSKYKWRASVSKWGTYAVTWMRVENIGRHVYLHRFLLDFPEGRQTKFANGDTLDCRRENLRPASRAEIQSGSGLGPNNKTGFKGVSFNKRSGKFKAYIKHNGKLLYLGLFHTAIDAARKYNEKSHELRGASAYRNRIPE